MRTNVLLGLSEKEGSFRGRSELLGTGCVVDWFHLIVKLLIEYYLIVNMSATGIWNNRYEGGPCYAACMETFTLYH